MKLAISCKFYPQKSLLDSNLSIAIDYRRKSKKKTRLELYISKGIIETHDCKIGRRIFLMKSEPRLHLHLVYQYEQIKYHSQIAYEYLLGKLKVLLYIQSIL